MSKIRTVISCVESLAAYQLHKKTVMFNLLRPTLSFAFDDFPRSALTQGGTILESHGVRGTFYISAGLCGTSSPSGEIATQTDLVACVERGHELACHTYDHMKCTQPANAEITASMEKNQAAIKAAGLPQLEHFSYPFGNINIAAKKLALHHYKSARTTQHGVNRNRIDLGALKAIRLYSTLGIKSWKPYMDSLASRSGWIIFYTHDVSDTPSAYGCTPAELHAIIAQAKAMDYDIVPVGEVVHRLSQAPSFN